VTIQWAPLALERVAEIGAYIYRENPKAAERWIRQIFARIEPLGEFPLSGKRNKETEREDIRELSWKNYRIIYRIDHLTVSVLTVRHAKQLLPLDELK